MKKIFYKLNLFIRTLIFSTINLITITIYSFFTTICAVLPLRFRYKLVVSYTIFALWLLKIICRIDYKVTGLENIPKDRTGIVLCKHQSTWETFFIPRFFNEIAIILKRELLWVPFFGWGLATIDPIAINRSDKSSAIEQIITKGKKCIEAGRWILVFPEGTRIPVGQVGKYRIGGARLACAAGAPVIPVAHNAGRFWPRRTFIKNPGTIQVIIGPLIETTDKTSEEVLEAVKGWIEEKMLKL